MRGAGGPRGLSRRANRLALRAVRCCSGRGGSLPRPSLSAGDLVAARLAQPRQAGHCCAPRVLPLTSLQFSRQAPPPVLLFPLRRSSQRVRRSRRGRRGRRGAPCRPSLPGRCSALVRAHPACLGHRWTSRPPTIERRLPSASVPTRVSVKRRPCRSPRGAACGRRCIDRLRLRLGPPCLPLIDGRQAATRVGSQ